VNGTPVPAGLPDQFSRYDLGFLRWYWHSGYRADFFSDDDLEHLSSARQLSRYRLIVFPGHEEYVTSHTFDVITPTGTPAATSPSCRPTTSSTR
jgi:hypothetical protein